MDYSIAATRATPALIIYLIDISGSMQDRFESGTKMDFVNDAIQRALSRMIARSMRGEVIAPRYRIAMAAYSEQVFDLLGGIKTIDHVAELGAPTLSPTLRTNTYAAFEWALQLLRSEMPRLAGMPAPMVCHLTDGEFTSGTPDPAPLAAEIMAMRNDDGHVLLENIYIGPDLTVNSIPSIPDWTGITQESQLKSPYARHLFRMSSPLPASYAEVISEDGYNLQAGSKMLIPGSSGSLIELAFAMSGATPVR